MRIEYQVSENGTHTGFRSANLEPTSEMTPATTATTYHLADSTPWGDLSLIIGLPHSRVMQALTMGLAQMAAQEAQQAKHAAWLATLARPAYVEKLIAEGDWPTLYRLRDQGKLHPRYEAQLPSANFAPTPQLSVNADEALDPLISSEELDQATVALMDADHSYFGPPPAALTAAPTAPKKPARPRSATTVVSRKATSAKSGGATASARSKRSSAASKRPSSSRGSSRAKSTAG